MISDRVCRFCAAAFASAGKRFRCEACAKSAIVACAACSVCGKSFLVRAGQSGLYCSLGCFGVSRRGRRSAEPKGKGHRGRARRFGVEYRPISRAAIFERDRWVCALCGDLVDPTVRYPSPWSASLDHVIPLSRGGAHIESNVQCAHLGCNIAKGAMNASK